MMVSILSRNYFVWGTVIFKKSEVITSFKFYVPQTKLFLGKIDTITSLNPSTVSFTHYKSTFMLFLNYQFYALLWKGQYRHDQQGMESEC